MSSQQWHQVLFSVSIGKCKTISTKKALLKVTRVEDKVSVCLNTYQSGTIQKGKSTLTS